MCYRQGNATEAEAAYREAVADEKSGEELVAILQTLGQAGEYHLAGEHYKRVPAGYEADHPRADLLRYAGFYAYPTAVEGKHLTSPELVDVCIDHFSNMAPVYVWLARYVGS